MLLISSAASPRVSYGLSHQKGLLQDRLHVVVSVASFEPGSGDSSRKGAEPAEKIAGITLELGLAADRVVVLSEKDARISQADGATTFEFDVPESKLVAGKDGW